jgi:hypothetical protein
MTDIKAPEFITVNKQKRTYYYPDYDVYFDNVVKVAASSKKDGERGGAGHRLETSSGKCFVVASGWYYIEIEFEGGKGWTF